VSQPPPTQSVTGSGNAQQAIQNQGVQVVVHHNSAADALEPEPSPTVDVESAGASSPAGVSNLGARNFGFIGRETELASIRQLLVERGRVVTRSRDRMGGVGKTQLAIEYAHRFAEDYDVMWLVAAEQDDLIGGHLAQLAVTARLVDPDVTTPAAVQALHTAMQTLRRWLLIFDNAEDPDRLAAWLPRHGGHLIITSRNPGWDEFAAPVDVSLFARSESVALLQSRLPDLSPRDAERLAEALGDLPLAVAQASKVLAQMGMPANEYLDLLDQHTTAILNEGKPSNYPTSLAAAISLSVDRLAQAHPAAAQLLNLCAVFAPERIPVDLFTRSPDLIVEPLASTSRNPLAFYNVVKKIGEHDLAGTSPQGLQMHRLIQAVVRDRIDSSELAEIRSQAAAVLTATAPGDTDDPATWSTWSALAPHIIAIDPATSDNERLRTAACQVMLYLLRRGENRPALNLAERLHQQWSERLGPNDVHTLKAATEHAHAIFVLGDMHGAHGMIKDNLTRYWRILGDDHPDTLRATDGLARTLHALGQHTQAREIQEDVLTRCRRVLGDNHPDTLRTAHNLAVGLTSCGQVLRARGIIDDVVKRLRRAIGPEHPDTQSALKTQNRIVALMGGVTRTKGKRPKRAGRR